MAIGRRFAYWVGDLEALPALGRHGLRHKHATLLIDDGVDLEIVSERLGHDSVRTTFELYGHVTPRMSSNVATGFGAVLNQSRNKLLTAVELSHRPTDLASTYADFSFFQDFSKARPQLKTSCASRSMGRSP